MEPKYDFTASRVLALAARDSLRRLADELVRIGAPETDGRAAGVLDVSYDAIAKLNDAIGAWTTAADLKPQPDAAKDAQKPPECCDDAACATEPLLPDGVCEDWADCEAPVCEEYRKRRQQQKAQEQPQRKWLMRWSYKDAGGVDVYDNEAAAKAAADAWRSRGYDVRVEELPKPTVDRGVGGGAADADAAAFSKRLADLTGLPVAFFSFKRGAA